MITNALLCRTNGEVETITDLEIEGSALCKLIGSRAFDLVRLSPSMVAPLEEKHDIKLWHGRRGEMGEDIYVYIVADDSGLIDNKPANPTATPLYAALGGITPIAGDVLICEVD